MSAQGDTPRTDERVRWMNNDFRYKAPEQAYTTACNHVQLLIGDCANLERDLSACRAELEKARERIAYLDAAISARGAK